VSSQVAALKAGVSYPVGTRSFRIATVPVTVEHSITDLGRTLTATVDALRIWAETHTEDVLASQQHHDARVSA
jgi:DNA-binding HxlR family transcriptional regulator